jgi:hypothetical protein
VQKKSWRYLLRYTIAGSAWLTVCLSPASRADGLDPLLDAVENSAPIINLRLRSETVGQDGFADDAQAVTLRSRLGFETGEAWSTSLLAEANLMWPLDQRYNSSINGETRYPLVADPEDTALDRLQLRNTSLPDTALTVGRQRINLDDQRFIGSVDFRQNEQTFDSARIVNRSIPDVTIDLTYLDRVNRVYGNRSAAGRYTGSSYLANIAYDTPVGRLVGFGYFLAFDQDHPDSTQSVGARFAGSRAFGGWSINYAASYASQKPYGANALRFDDHYAEGEITATVRGFTAGGGIEVLGGNGIKGFTTPLATLHKFDGWANEFLTTPANGLRDRYATISYGWKRVEFLDGLSATAVYHDFESDRLDIRYGTESDLMLLGKWRRYSAMIAYGDYSREQFAASTRRLWVELDYVLNDP